MGNTPCTPKVFCAVNDEITLAPNTPSAEKVFISAWMPAPPPLSLPAIVNAMGVWTLDERLAELMSFPLCIKRRNGTEGEIKTLHVTHANIGSSRSLRRY